MKTALPTSAPATVVDGVRIHGEIVSWDVPYLTRIPHTTLVAALTASGLDASASRPMAARNAFARACRTLEENRIIRKVTEDGLTMRFQFTAEERDGDRLRYDCQTVLVLDKVACKVASEVVGHDDLVAKAQAAIDAEAATRTGNDITDIVQRLFRRHADMFPIRAAGGCYFVPNLFEDFLAKIDAFLTAVGAILRRFPVPAGSPHGDKSVAGAVADGMRALIDDHLAAIAKFTVTETKDKTLETMVGRINATRFKLDAYAEFLGEQKDAIVESIAEARQALRDKIAELGKGVLVPEEKEKPAPSVPYSEMVARREAVDSAFAAIEAV